jgi:hypothetical protein
MAKEYRVKTKGHNGMKWINMEDWRGESCFNWKERNEYKGNNERAGKKQKRWKPISHDRFDVM